MITEVALRLYAAKKEGIIRSNAQFWREYSHGDKITHLSVKPEKYVSEIEKAGICLICALDDGFPPLPDSKPSEKPYLFAYKGDISLLYDRANNIAVVGTLTPSPKVLRRERAAVEALTERGLHIVSGLAEGCDTAAHEECLRRGGKTIAFLPSTISNIYPKANAPLAESIVQNGGLILTEYIAEPETRYECVRRLIERDRLQAMFAGNILLIASNLPGQGDSGSRHAMEKAKAYGTGRFVLYDRTTDADDPLFALNRQLLGDGASIFTRNALNSLSYP